MSAQTPPVGTLLGGHYLLERMIGSGGMGAVFEAVRGDQRFAVKVLLSENGDAQDLARFLREGQVASALQGPNVVPVVDLGFDASLGRPYLVMPLLRGRDLSQVLSRGPLHPTVAARVIAQAAAGVVSAHANGVIHRDLKPANLFLDVDEGAVTVRVCDFGIAKVNEALQASLTSTGTIVGTMLYMAPEQFLNSKKVDERADVWALAITLYEALCGLNPFEHATTFAELVLLRNQGKIPSVQETAPWVEPGLAEIVHGGLIVDIEKRCPTAKAFLDALLPFTGGALDLGEAMLAPIPPELREYRASRASAVNIWTGNRSAPAALAVRDPRIGHRVGGKFQLNRLLGRGGMGDVYEATDDTGHSVAVKVISSSIADAGARHRFVREARATMAITSSHVVRVVAADTDPVQGAPFMAMELLRGVDLSALVKASGPLEPAAACLAFVQACEGLSAAHKLRIVHRDIKPANLFCHELPSGEVVIKVCDFGVAKETSVSGVDQTTADLTRTGGLLGSPIYMSPEQARNAKQVDARTDVWSLCMAFYEALSGRAPWAECTSIGELILAICTTDITPLQEVAPWVNGAIAVAIHKGLSREASARWASVDELREALLPLCANGPLTKAALTSLSAAQRQVAAPRVSVTALASTAGAITSSSQTSSASRPSRAAPIAAFALFACLGLVGLNQFRGASSSATAGIVPTPDASPSKSQALVKSRVTVKPASAAVQLRGVTQKVDPDGGLILEGQPGETLEVSVKTDGDPRVFRVVLTMDGHAEPSVLEASTSGGPAPATAVASAASATPASTAVSAKNNAGTPSKTTTPSTAAAPATAATVGGQPKMKDDL